MDKQRLIIVAAAVVQLALGLVFAGRYKMPTAPAGAMVLRYGWQLRAFALCLAFAIPLWTIIFFATLRLLSDASLLPIGICFLLCGCAGSVLLLETQGVYFIVA